MKRNRRAYKKILQRNLEEENYKSDEKFKLLNIKVKELVKESKRKLDEEFIIKLSEKFNEN